MPVTLRATAYVLREPVRSHDICDAAPSPGSCWLKVIRRRYWLLLVPPRSLMIRGAAPENGKRTRQFPAFQKPLRVVALKSALWRDFGSPDLRVPQSDESGTPQVTVTVIVAMIAGNEHEITATTAISAAVRSDDPGAVVGAIVPICGGDTMACKSQCQRAEMSGYQRRSPARIIFLRRGADHDDRSPAPVAMPTVITAKAELE